MKKSFLFLIVIFAILLIISGCPDPINPEETTNLITTDPTQPSNPVSTNNISDDFWWGTWQSMADGKFYVITEDRVFKYDDENSLKVNRASETYEIGKNSSADLLNVQAFGDFSKKSERIIEHGDIPFFRKGGSNLEFSLTIVGFQDSEPNTSSRVVSSVGRSGFTAVNRSGTYPHYEEAVTSNSEGVLICHAPTVGDNMTVTLETSEGKVTVPDIIVETNGANMGTIPIAEPNRYVLKVSGIIAEEEKTDGYLFASNYKSYPLIITITNVSENPCNSSFYEITPKDSFLTLSAASGNRLSDSLATMQKGATQTVNVIVECGDIDSPYVDTGVNVTLSNSQGTWVDYIPLRFYKGLVPITFSARSLNSSSTAALNGFVIYPDNNTKFFAIDQVSPKTLYLPSFGNNKKYTLVFSGATTSQNLSQATEMFYTAAIGKMQEKTVVKPDSSSEHTTFVTFGEGTAGNETEENAFDISEDFEAYLAAGEKDYYLVTFQDESIIKAGDVPKSYWESSSFAVEVLPDSVIAGNSYGVYVGTFANGNSWVIYKFRTAGITSYSIELGDAENSIYCTDNFSCSGTCRISVSKSYSGNDFSTWSSNSPQNFSVNSYNDYVYVKVKSNSTNGGTYSIRIKDQTGSPVTLSHDSNSGYAGFSWSCDFLATNADSDIYYFYAEKDTDYTLTWSDAGEGFGHTADVKVSACTDYPDFTFTSSTKLFENKDNGYRTGQRFFVENNGYVFIQIKPQNIQDNFIGNYALKLTYDEEDENSDIHNWQEDLIKYDRSTFVINSGAAITNSDTWLWGMMMPNGYEVFKFPVVQNAIYAVTWDDSRDGTRNYTADVEVSAYSDESLSVSSRYWTADSGYTTVKTLEPDTNGFAYIKIVRKDNTQGQKSFRIAVSYGLNRSLTTSIEEVESLNCAFEGFKVSTLQDSAWIAGNLRNNTSEEIYYFRTTENSAYKLYADDSCNELGTYSGAVEVCSTTNPVTLGDASFLSPTYRSPVSYSFPKEEARYIIVRPYNSLTSNIGTYAITLLDGNNRAVNLTRYTAYDGANIPAAKWLTGEITSASESIMYRFVVSKNTFTTIFWDDKKSGSGRYSGDIEVSFGSLNEDDVVQTVFDSGYTKAESKFWSATDDDIILYLKVSAKSGLATNIGTFAIAVMEGNEANETLHEVQPQTTITIDSLSDIQLTHTNRGETYTFTAQTGFEAYKWYIDGILQNSVTGNTFAVDVASWVEGTYEIEVEAIKNSLYYSGTIFLNIQ